MSVAAKPSDNFGDISLTKAILGKYLMENCFSELCLQLSIKYFANLSSILKLFSQVSHVQTTLVKKISRHEWANRPILSWPCSGLTGDVKSTSSAIRSTAVLSLTAKSKPEYLNPKRSMLATRLFTVLTAHGIINEQESVDIQP